ncbi:unnamed protein product [Polarella glacialis]|uniref:PDZ domain-containing protein n=1 Tax=Polarella glacialis TaxID=89957 RepID=A0A813JGV3_POLGL|nr:unnamed protein product [Polarella glacialis]
MSGDEKQATTLFEKITPGVVSITREPPQALVEGEEKANVAAIAGSGFVWDKQFVVTNLHVINGIEKPYVTFLIRDPKGTTDKRTTLTAEIIGSDLASDIAVLRVGGRQKDAAGVMIPLPPDLMRVLPRGKSATLLVGQNVFAFGNPFGLEHSMSYGIISGVSRRLETNAGRPISGVIQTDASINPGNSGGPLLNSDGEVIGVNTAILSASGMFAGVGLAVPIDTVERNVQSIISKGFVRRPVLGIIFAPDAMSQELQLNGCLVMKVVPDGPAATAGIRPMRGGRLGDVVMAMDKKRINSTDDLFALLDQKVPGDIVKLTVQRPTMDAESDKFEEKVISIELAQQDV